MGGRITFQKPTVVNTGQKSIGNTAAIIVATNAAMNGLSLKNISANTVYLGNSNVNATNGYPLQQNEEYKIDHFAGPAIYGITSSSTSTVGFIYYTD